MVTVTIPQSFAKDASLVAVPKGTYEEFLSWEKHVKSMREFHPSLAEKKALTSARKNLARGKYVPFEILEHELDARRR